MIVTVAFDEAKHEYRLPTGTRVPSVTEVLRATGVACDYEAQVARIYANGLGPSALAFARARGVAVHSDAHAYDDGALDDATVDPSVRPYLNAWIAFRANSGLVPVARERRIYHPTFHYAGTLDGIFVNPQGKKREYVLVDLKTGDPEQSACRFQTAAYAEAVRTEGFRERLERMAVHLCPECQIPYRVTPYSYSTQGADFRKFTAFLTTYQEQYYRRSAA